MLINVHRFVSFALYKNLNEARAILRNNCEVFVNFSK